MGNGRILRALGGQVLKTVLLLVAVSLLSFLLVTASPIDPVQQYILKLGSGVSAEQRQQIEQYWGVNEPPGARFLHWGSEVLRGNLGESLLFRRPVGEIIRERFANSLALMAFAWGLSGIAGFALGCLMGKYNGRPLERVLRRICYLLGSIPAFWFGLLVLLLFAVKLGWFPIGFSGPIGVLQGEVSFWERLHHLLLPGLTLATMSVSGIALHTREKLLEVYASDYVRFARARGEGEWGILWRHGVRNVLFPAISLQFASFAELFGGSVLAEQVFSYPGLGSAVTSAGLAGDVPLLLGITLFSALFVSVGNLIANLLYKMVDPKLREESI